MLALGVFKRGGTPTPGSIYWPNKKADHSPSVGCANMFGSFPNFRTCCRAVLLWGVALPAVDTRRFLPADMRDPTLFFFPRMRSERFLFYFGGLGVETCSLDSTLLLRPQVSATVRNRLRAIVARVIWPCLWRVYKSGHFWRFQMSRSLALRGRRSTSDVSCCVFVANRLVRAAM